MSLIEFSDDLRYSLSLYSSHLQDIKFKLYANDGKKMIVTFPKLFFLSYIGIGGKHWGKNGTETYEIPEIRKNFYYKLKDLKLDDCQISRMKEACNKISSLSTFTLNTIHSIIENNGETYLVLASDFEFPVIRLMKNKYYNEHNFENYMIIDIDGKELLEKLINDKDSYKTFLKGSGYKNDKVNIKYWLNPYELQQRIIDFEDFKFIDEECNQRSDNDIISVEQYYNRTPRILKKIR